MDGEILRKDVAGRMLSFEMMPKRYFRTVEVIDAESYTSDRSENYDVTVMDGMPKSILPKVVEKDKEERLPDIWQQDIIWRFLLSDGSYLVS